MIEVVMKTFANSMERVELFRRTIHSFMQSNPRPTIKIFDDCSDTEKYDAMAKIVEGIDGIEYMRWRVRKDHSAASMWAIADRFDTTPCDAVMILDADSLFNRSWWEVAARAFIALGQTANFGAVTIYNNEHYHQSFPVYGMEYRGKSSCQGFATIIGRKFWETTLIKTNWYSPSSWDHNAREYINHPWKVYCTAKTYIQHTGNPENPHAKADNFVGE
jgi:hypothetical protein